MKYVFLILLLVCITSYIVTIMDIYRRSKTGYFQVYWLWIILLLPIIGPAVYLSCRKKFFEKGRV
jgi:hypothetical protein